MVEEQYSLSWDNFHKNMSNGMRSLLENEDLVDVTLAVEGKHLKAHKIVLSICSPYFKELFQTNPCKHPIVFMKDVSYIAMNDLLTFMYQGEVQVNQEHINVFIKTAEALKIQGITGDSNESTELIEDDYRPEEVVLKPITIQNKPSKPKKVLPPSLKRRRLSDSSEKEVEIPTTEEIIEFKMEPFEDSHSGQHLHENYDNLDEVANEDYREVTVEDGRLDDTGNIDDPEDYSMLEDEPKPGSSNEVAVSDGQDKLKTSRNISRSNSSTKKSSTIRNRYVVDGFVYHTNLISGHPPIRYLGCAETKRLGCRARAIMPLNEKTGEIKLKQGHNHPRDINAEEKDRFLKELKRVVVHMAKSTLRHVYDMVAKIYPKAAEEIPFKSVCSSLHRWRRRSEQGVYIYKDLENV